jgi:Domain of unknown function (DUF4232)
MSPINRKQWRVAAAVIATVAAVLTPAAALAAPAHPVAALAAPAHPAARTATSAPACATSALRVWLGVPGEGAASSIYYPLELSNVSSHTCTLFGFPGVSAVAPGGAQLGSPASRDHSDPTLLVTLSPGATAHVLLRIVAVGVFPPSTCQPTNAIGLKVYPPNNTAATVVGFPFQACAKSGPVFLTVRTTVAGTGIPGFSS